MPHKRYIAIDTRLKVFCALRKLHKRDGVPPSLRMLARETGLAPAARWDEVCAWLRKPKNRR